MFRDLPRYGEYAPNTSPWLRELPSHWPTRRTKALLSERTQKGYADEPLLAATQRHGVIRKSDYGTRTVTATKDLHLLKLVEVGDFVISLRSFQGGIERCYNRGIISPAYTVLSAKTGGYRDYLTFLFKSRPFVNSLTLAVTGIREGQNIDYSRLAVDLLPVPPVDEQAAIVKYLAYANVRIDKAITAKRRLIALLEEQKQQRVHQWLTSGVDSADCRDIDLPWSESAPRSWVVAPVKRLFSSMVYGTSDSSMGEGPVTAVGMGEIQNGCVNIVRRGGLAKIPEGLDLRPGDLLFNRTNSPDLVGKVGRVLGDCENLTFASYLVRCRVATGIDAEWAAYLLNDPAFLGFARSQAFVSLHQANLSSSRFGALPVVVPPYGEQREIAATIRAANAEASAVITRATREVALLQEFRTRLVADVVTGQVDVRAMAATLPDAPASVSNLAAESDDELDAVS
jgi:type I restriction enzyme S subunit